MHASLDTYRDEVFVLWLCFPTVVMRSGTCYSDSGFHIHLLVAGWPGTTVRTGNMYMYLHRAVWYEGVFRGRVNVDMAWHDI